MTQGKVNYVAHQPQDELKKLAEESFDVRLGDCFVKAMMHDKDIAALIVYNNYRPKICCDMHWIRLKSVSYLNKSILFDWFFYPFIYLGVNRVQATIECDNDSVLRYMQRLGFIPEGRLRQASQNLKDVFVFGMLKHECKWIK